MNSKFSRRSFLKSAGLAALAGGFGLSGLSGIKRVSASDHLQGLPRLLYLFPGTPQADVATVQAALSEYMAERIGATIELRAIDWGAFNDQIGLINASGENYDLGFTAPWTNNYYSNVDQEYLAPIGDLLPDLAPGYWASMTPETWEAARVAGNIYAGINQQIFVKPFGPYIRADVLEAIGAADAFKALTGYAGLTDILAAAKDYVDGDDILTHVTYYLDPIMVPENWGFDPVDGLLVVKSTDASAQVQIFSETDEFRQGAELVRSWLQAGFAPADPATLGSGDEAWAAGLFAVRVSDIVKPGGNAEVEARWGVPVASRAIAEPLLTTGSVTATLNGVSSISANRELAVKFLELVNTDPVFYNTLCKGLQGVHWDWADEASLLIKPAGGAASFGDTGYAPNTDWMYGNVFNSYYTDPTQVGAWPETAALNRGARPSPVLGFTFDRAAVDTEVASVAAVVDEFANPIRGGFVDPATAIPALNDALQAAGIGAIRDEMQRQVDAWLAAKA
ncbi:MAG: ABC transporter substrate-binding protein [Anaerolineae bacterium]|nr:ABC transporter substrate-binding protein [Anaerolineae bacterium]